MKRILIIPAYNEGQRIERTLMIAVCSELFDKIVVVVDGHEDDTEKKCRGFPVHVVTSPVRLGKGGAILRGYEAIVDDSELYDMVLISDADRSVPFVYARPLFQHLEKYDMAIASRYKAKSNTMGQPFQRRLLSFGFRFLCDCLFGLGLSDYQCGFKAMRRYVLDELHDKFVTSGFAWDVELLVRAKRAGLTVREVAVSWRHSEGSKVKRGTAWKMLKDVVRIYRTSR